MRSPALWHTAWGPTATTTAPTTARGGTTTPTTPTTGGGIATIAMRGRATSTTPTTAAWDVRLRGRIACLIRIVSSTSRVAGGRAAAAPALMCHKPAGGIRAATCGAQGHSMGHMRNCDFIIQGNYALFMAGAQVLS